MARPKKPKAVNYKLISQDEDPGLYMLMERIKDESHPHLGEARILMAWRRALKPDPDGKLMLGKCKKASDLDKQLSPWDFVIILNEQAYGDLDDKQRHALIDHELCHAQVARSKDGEIKRDETGRQVFRTRKHDIEEFTEVIDRHGCYKSDLTAFAESCARRRKTPLFETQPDPEPQPNGEATGQRPAPKRPRRSRSHA